MAKDDVVGRWSWAGGGISLAPAATTSQPAKGDITGDAPAAQDPDQLLGSLTWTHGGALIGTSSFATPQPGRGDISTDNQFSPGSKAIPETWAAGGPALTPGALASSPAHGDIGDEYQPGEPTTPGQISGGITWTTGGVPIAAGATTHNAGKGDITGDYGRTELWQEIATWAAGSGLTPGALTPTTGKGDFPDPNTWQDVILYRTSKIYPLVVIENMANAISQIASPAFMYTEHIRNVGSLFDTGTLYLGLVTYSNWPIEHMQESGSISSGSLTVPTPPVIYSNWPAENMQEAGSIASGTFYLGLITYMNWPAEHMQNAASITGGTLQ